MKGIKSSSADLTTNFLLQSMYCTSWLEVGEVDGAEARGMLRWEVGGGCMWRDQ